MAISNPTNVTSFLLLCPWFKRLLFDVNCHLFFVLAMNKALTFERLCTKCSVNGRLSKKAYLLQRVKMTNHLPMVHRLQQGGHQKQCFLREHQLHPYPVDSFNQVDHVHLVGCIHQMGHTHQTGPVPLKYIHLKDHCYLADHMHQVDYIHQLYHDQQWRMSA